MRLKYINLFIIVAIILVVAFVFVPYNPNAIVAAKYLAPSWEHLFGTDYVGRDLFSRVVQATVISAVTIFAAVAVGTIVGFLYGSYAGYRGGATKRAMLGGLNIFDSIPDFLLAIALLLLFTTIPGIGSMLGLFIVAVLVSWTPIARIVANETTHEMSRGYIMYATANGAGWWHIMRFHLAPVLRDNLLTIAIQKVPSLILISAFLGFIGVGFQPPEANLGKMISEGSLVFRAHPHVLLFPMIFLVVLTQIFALGGYLLRRRREATEHTR